MLPEILTVLCLVLGLVWLLWKFKLRKYSDFKFSPTIPIIGHALNFPYDPHEFLLFVEGQLRLHGDTCIVWTGPIASEDIVC